MTLPTSACHSTVPKELRDFPATRPGHPGRSSRDAQGPVMLSHEKPTCCAPCAPAPTRCTSYMTCASSGPSPARDGGHDPVPGHAGDHRWKHRVRGALASLRRRRAGGPDQLAPRWASREPRSEPARLLLIIAGAEPREFELRLAAAADLLAQLDMPADLVLCDPPYGLGRAHRALLFGRQRVPPRPHPDRERLPGRSPRASTRSSRTAGRKRHAVALRSSGSRSA